METTSVATPVARGAKRGWIGTAMLSVGLIALATACLVGWMLARFGSVHSGLAYLSGERVFVDPSTIRVGVIAKDDQRVVRLTLQNQSDRAIRVLGQEASCSCSVVGGLPEVLPARSTCPLDLKINTIRKEVGKLDVVLKLFTDHPSRPFIAMHIPGEVRELASPLPSK